MGPKKNLVARFLSSTNNFTDAHENQIGSSYSIHLRIITNSEGENERVDFEIVAGYLSDENLRDPVIVNLIAGSTFKCGHTKCHLLMDDLPSIDLAACSPADLGDTLLAASKAVKLSGHLIKHWAKIGKTLEDNPEMTYEDLKVLQDINLEVQLGQFSEFKFSTSERH